MEKYNSLVDVKNELGIDKWSEFKPAQMIPQLFNIYQNTDSNVIIESFKQFPQLATYLTNYINAGKEETKNIIDTDAVTTKNIMDGYDEMINIFSEKITDERISFEEKKYYVDMMFKVQDKKIEVKVANQKWFDKMKEYGLVAAPLVFVGVLAFFGKNIDISNIKFKK